MQSSTKARKRKRLPDRRCSLCGDALRLFWKPLAVLLLAATVQAHTFPVKLVDHASRLHLTRDALVIDYSIVMSEIEAARMRAVLQLARKAPSADSDENDYIRSVADQVMAGLKVSLDGTPLPVDNLHRYRSLEPVGMQYRFRVRLPALSGGNHHLVVRDSNDEDVAGSETIDLTVDPGLEVLGLDRSWRTLALVLRFPDNRPAPRVFTHSQTIARAENNATKSPPLSPGSSGRAEDTGLFARIRSILSGPLDSAILFSSLLLALLVGGLHALQPGHGKTLVAAYLVGSRGTARHAVLLGLIVTFTHTFSVLLLGIVTLFLSHLIRAETVNRWLEIGSALLVTAMGAWLLFRAVRGRHSSDHHHHHPHSRRHTASAADRAHHHHSHDGHHHHGVAPGREGTDGVSFWNLLVLGVTGGIVPCPDAIILLLIAVGFNQVTWGLVLILVFSAGIAAVLIAVGLLMVSGSALVQRLDRQHRLVQVLPIVSAAFILLIGTAMLIRCL
jgi:nickel/cobalt exporter